MTFGGKPLRAAWLFFALVTSLAILAPRPSAAGPYGAQCVPVWPTVPGHFFYVDPVLGSATGDGSSKHPWKSLQTVVNTLVRSARYPVPYVSGGRLLIINPTGPVHPGDTIFVRSGNHGVLTINGYVNTAFITIAADTGAIPVFSSIAIAGASHWLLRGLTVQSNVASAGLVQLENSNFWGPVDNIIFDHNVVRSQADVSTWSQADWRNKGAHLGINSSATCSQISNNAIMNLQFGILAGPPGYSTSTCASPASGNCADLTINNNSIDNFGDDAIDLFASQVSILANRITNNHNIGDENHNDGVQGGLVTVSGATPSTYNNNDIENNIIIAQTQPMTLPSVPGVLQGIDHFDGLWTNLRIINNVVISSAFHGISVLGASLSVPQQTCGSFGSCSVYIANNTVASVRPDSSIDQGNPDVPAWIGVFPYKNSDVPCTSSTIQYCPVENPTGNVVIANNVSENYQLLIATAGGSIGLEVSAPLSYASSGNILRGNIQVTNPAVGFNTFDTVHDIFNLMLTGGPACSGSTPTPQPGYSAYNGCP